MDPGPWAHWILKMGLKVAKNGDHVETETLRILTRLSPRQELVLNPGRGLECPGMMLYNKLSESTKHVEGAALQVAGIVHEGQGRCLS